MPPKCLSTEFAEAAACHNQFLGIQLVKENYDMYKKLGAITLADHRACPEP